MYRYSSISRRSSWACLAVVVVSLLSGCGSGVGDQTFSASTATATATATALRFVTQPSNMLRGAQAPAVTVSVVDAAGSVVPTANATVTLALANNPVGGVLGGTLTAAAVDGVATFTGFTVDKASNAYTLEASAGGLTPATSNPFKVIRNLSFGAPVFTATTGNKFNQQMVAAGDFNKDGRDDMVFADNDNARVIIGLSNGDGSLTTANVATANGPSSVAVADFDGDGNLDVAAACSNGTGSFLRGQGNGTFFAKVDVTNGNAGSLSNIASGDFDRDGRLDAMMTDSGTGGLSIFRNGGNFTFAATNYGSGGKIGTDIAGIAAGDFNGDGFLDVATVQVNTDIMSVWISSGSPTLAQLFPSAGITQHTFGFAGNGDGAKGLIAADLDADGFVDISVADRIPRNGIYNAWTYRNPGNGVFGVPNPSRVGSDPFGIFTADFNQDALLDLGLATGFGLDLARGDFEVLLGLGDTNFQAVTSFLVTGADFVVRAGATGDFNGDGLPDAIVATDGTVVAIFLNTSQ